MVNYPILYAAIMTLWLVALPGYLLIYCVSGIGSVMSVVVQQLLVYLFWVLWEPL